MSSPTVDQTNFQEAAMRYRLADHGLVFSTRDRGSRVLADLREKMGNAPDVQVQIDFAGIRSVSYSFVDEFVGELMQAIDAADAIVPAFVNVPASAVRTIERSLRRRGVDTELCLSQDLQTA